MQDNQVRTMVSPSLLMPSVSTRSMVVPSPSTTCQVFSELTHWKKKKVTPIAVDFDFRSFSQLSQKG